LLPTFTTLLSHSLLLSPYFPPSLVSCFPVPVFLFFPLFPYTTLFRSKAGSSAATKSTGSSLWRAIWLRRAIQATRSTTPTATTRSEEHTSELQSREKLVCRLLLEKKKKRHMERGDGDGWRNSDKRPTR